MPSSLKPVLTRCGLKPADQNAYSAWIQQRRRRIASGLQDDAIR
jgi:hypothetical protein